MAARQSQKVEPPKVIGAISKFAGVLVGTAVVTGKHIVKTATQAGEGSSGEPREKIVLAPVRKKKKKAAVKTKAKGRKVKKKVAKKKRTGPAGNGRTPRKGPAQSPAKKRKHQAKIS